MAALVPDPNEAENQRRELGRAKIKAFQFKKGQSGNALGLNKFYLEARRLAREASPAAMKELINLMMGAEDERVRSLCALAVLDRSGVRPLEHQQVLDEIEAQKKAQKSEFDPSLYSPDQLSKIEAALRIIIAVRDGTAIED